MIENAVVYANACYNDIAGNTGIIMTDIHRSEMSHGNDTQSILPITLTSETNDNVARLHDFQKSRAKGQLLLNDSKQEIVRSSEEVQHVTTANIETTQSISRLMENNDDLVISDTKVKNRHFIDDNVK